MASGGNEGEGKAVARIAVLLTSHNRVASTLLAIESVLAQERRGSAFEIEVVLCDDASTDGTADAVLHRFPRVHVLPGSGSLYWNGGMRRAFDWALGRDFTHFLWLNDDVELLPDSVSRLLGHCEDATRRSGASAAIVGATSEPGSDLPSYGGWRSTSRWNRARVTAIRPSSELSRCDTMNGNCVLIPRSVATVVGSLEPRFIHALGDFDYGFRINDAGFGLYVSPGFVGECRRNTKSHLRDAAGRSPLERWRDFIAPKRMPIGPWRLYTRRYSGPMWIIYFVGPYIKFWMREASGIFSTAGRS